MRQRSVRKGMAGSPSRLTRFGWASSRQPKRTATGLGTRSLATTIDAPSIRASAGWNTWSSPAIVKCDNGWPSLAISPPPTWSNSRRILWSSAFIER